MKEIFIDIGDLILDFTVLIFVTLLLALLVTPFVLIGLGIARFFTA